MTFPRILGHEVSPTVLENTPAAKAAGVETGDHVTLSPYTMYVVVAMYGLRKSGSTGPAPSKVLTVEQPGILSFWPVTLSDDHALSGQEQAAAQS